MESDQVLNNIPPVTISPQGIFKYILIQAHIDNNGAVSSANFVRGNQKWEYHKENFQDFMNQVKNQGFQLQKKDAEKGYFQAVKGAVKVTFTCPGGGRIQHNYNGKKCFIYGYSKSYGRVDHKVAALMVSQALKYPLIEVTTSQEGY